MPKKLLWFFLFLVVAVVVGLAFFRFGWPLLQPNSGQLSVNTPVQASTVYLDGKNLGPTPFYSQTLKVGDHTVRIESDGSSWETKTSLSDKTFATIDLNLAKVALFTSGENLFFRAGQKGLIVLSKPEAVTVLINGQDKGKTPLRVEPETGVMTLTLKKDGYLTREISANTVENYRLTANAFLSVDPFGTVKKLDANSKITILSLHNNFIDLSKSYSDWAEGVGFTQNQLGGAETRFDLLLDPNGKTYIFDQTQWQNKVATKAVANVGYLSTKADDQLTTAAKAEWDKLKAQFN